MGELKNTLKNMSAEDFRSKYGRDKPNLISPIVFSCRSGKRSDMAMNKAIQLGYSK